MELYPVSAPQASRALAAIACSGPKQGGDPETQLLVRDTLQPTCSLWISGCFDRPSWPGLLPLTAYAGRGMCAGTCRWGDTVPGCNRSAGYLHIAPNTQTPNAVCLSLVVCSCCSQHTIIEENKQQQACARGDCSDGYPAGCTSLFCSLLTLQPPDPFLQLTAYHVTPRGCCGCRTSTAVASTSKGGTSSAGAQQSSRGKVSPCTCVPCCLQEAVG
jgi:hypothetical protein